jgi:hypothetical protein
MEFEAFEEIEDVPAMEQTKNIVGRDQALGQRLTDIAHYFFDDKIVLSFDGGIAFEITVSDDGHLRFLARRVTLH